MNFVFNHCFKFIQKGTGLMVVPFLIFTISTVLTIKESSAAPITSRPAYILGVFPYLPARELEKVFSPVAADLGDALQRKVLVRSSTSYRNFMNNLDKEKYDIVFVQPFDYVRIADKYGYLPIATRSEPLAAILVVPENSKLNNAKDLYGKKIALPPSVAAVSHLVKGYLREQGVNFNKDVKLQFTKSHVSCMQQLLIGSADACGTAAPAKRFFEHKMNVNLKVIAQTASIPHTLFAIHPRIPAAERETIQARILSWSTTEKGKQILARGRLKPFIKISDSAYDVVRHYFENEFETE
jgi:phosphonate transport system substrate-binding protein